MLTAALSLRDTTTLPSTGPPNADRNGVRRTIFSTPPPGLENRYSAAPRQPFQCFHMSFLKNAPRRRSPVFASHLRPLLGLRPFFSMLDSPILRTPPCALRYFPYTPSSHQAALSLCPPSAPCCAFRASFRHTPFRRWTAAAPLQAEAAPHPPAPASNARWTPSSVSRAVFSELLRHVAPALDAEMETHFLVPFGSLSCVCVQSDRASVDLSQILFQRV